MSAQANRSRYLPLLIVGIAVILFSTAGIAAIMAWLPAAAGASGDTLAPDDRPAASSKQVTATTQMAPLQAEEKTRAKGGCAECGVIVSTREIDARDEGTGVNASGKAVSRNRNEPRLTSARRYEITIRLADRSSRVIDHASPAIWRAGERVIVIDGAKPLNR